MNVNRRFKEVNIAFALLSAFHHAGYWAFPEFPYDARLGPSLEFRSR